MARTCHFQNAVKRLWEFQTIELLLCNITCRRAHDEVDLVRGAIDLREQSFQIDSAAGPRSGDHQFHPTNKSQLSRML